MKIYNWIYESIFLNVINWKNDCSEVGDNDGYARTEADDL